MGPQSWAAVQRSPLLAVTPELPLPPCTPELPLLQGLPASSEPLGQLCEDRCPGLVTQWLLSQCPSPSLHGKRAGILLGHLWALCVGCASQASCIH